MTSLRIYDPASKTYGSGWTADLAEKLGKRVQRIPIRTNSNSNSFDGGTDG